MSELAAQVTAVLARSVLPSVIARGGTIRVASAGADGAVTLEVTGSPGAALPLASRIEAAVRAAVPQVTAVRLVTPGTGPSSLGPGPPPIWRRPPGRCWTPRSTRRSPPTAAA